MELASTTLMKPPVMRFSSLESGVLTIVKQGNPGSGAMCEALLSPVFLTVSP